MEKLAAAVQASDTQDSVNACRLAAVERVVLHVLQNTNGALARDYGEFMMSAANRGEELRAREDKRWPNVRK